MSSREKTLELLRRREKAVKGGGDEALGKQIALGKLNARDRIIALLDKAHLD